MKKLRTNLITKVAVCQVPDIREDIETSLAWIEKFTAKAETKDVSLICFPECFLQGYLTQKKSAEKYSINLISIAPHWRKSSSGRLAPVKVAENSDSPVPWFVPHHKCSEDF